MYCKNCGKQLIEDSKFCSVCGTAINGNTDKPVKKSKKKPLIICISIIAVLILAIAVVLIVINNSDKSADAEPHKNQKAIATETTESTEKAEPTEKTADNESDTETTISREDTENDSSDKDENNSEIADVSGDSNDTNAIDLYQSNIGSGKCALFYISGSDVPLCAYKSEDGKKEILLVYNKSNSNIDVFDMGDDTKLYYDDDRVMFQYTSVRENSTDYNVKVYSIIGEISGEGHIFGSEGYEIDKYVSESGEVTYSSGQDVCDEKWYNDNIKVLDTMKTIDYKYDTIYDAYAAIDKKEMYLRKALAAYDDAAYGNKCTVIYLTDGSTLPVCIYEIGGVDQHLLAYINGELKDIVAVSQDSTVNYNRKTKILRMDSNYGNTESESNYAEYYKVTKSGIESLIDTFVYNKQTEDGNGGIKKFGFEYEIGENKGLTEEKFNKAIAEYGDSADFEKVYCGYTNVYYSYKDLLAGKDTQNSWKKSYKNGISSVGNKCISTVLLDINNDKIPEVFCQWDEGNVSYTMDCIDKDGNVDRVLYYSNIVISTADDYVKISGGHSGTEFDTIYKYDKSTGKYDVAFDRTASQSADGNMVYELNGKKCSDAEYKHALDQFTQKITFTDIDFETMSKSQKPMEAIQYYN